MRASRGGAHVSGAERIVPPALVERVVSRLAGRALSHPKGVPDFINLKVERAENVLRLKSLPVTTHPTRTPEEGMRVAAELLSAAGITRIAEIMRLFRETYPMRGAMLLDADTLERLEPDRGRGVRATVMDSADSALGAPSCGKDHYAEAVVLATKVANAPGIVGEICVSDDPDYVTGYVATKDIGYCRIGVVKHKGDECGGRIFLYRGKKEDVPKTLEFLEKTAVLVEGVPKRERTENAPDFSARLAEIDAAGLRRSCRVSPSPTGPESDSLAVLSSNDYLDLARDGRVTEAAAEAARRWGAGTGGSRLTTGTQSPHAALERHLAAFKGTESALLYATGYMANVGAVSALVGKGDVVFSDELNHASIIDGCRLSGAEVVVYRHGDMAELERSLASAHGYGTRLVVSDAVFSMDGDILDLPRFLDVARRYGAVSMVDEAHATGVIGATGRGIVEHFGCGHPDVAVGTLSKALGAEGGFVCASRTVVDWLMNKSRSFIFSTAPCAAGVAAADAALGVLESEPWRVARLREDVRFFVGELASRGVSVTTESAIVPILVGDEKRAVEASERIREKGFLIPAIRYPTVAKGSARLRAAVMLGHDRSTLSSAASAIAAALESIPRP